MRYFTLLLVFLLSSVYGQSTSKLDAVVITAGAFEASDSKKSVTLRPLDIVTTAGANGDVLGALQTLPGAQSEVQATS